MDRAIDIEVTSKTAYYYIRTLCACYVRRLIFNFLWFEFIVVDSSYIVSDV